MGFVGVCKAIYDYVPQSEGELAIEEGDLLYILEKSTEDDWWKAKKKADADDDDEPIGLVPNNYVEEATAVTKARSLYEYTRQTDEELSFPEDAVLEVFDTSDPDWILVGHDADYGFVPANYIDMDDGAVPAVGAAADSLTQPESIPAAAPPALPPSLPQRPPMPEPEPTRDEEPQSPPLPQRQSSHASESASIPPPPGPASTLANVMQGRSPSSRAAPMHSPQMHSPPMTSPDSLPIHNHYVVEEEEEEPPSPALPTRPQNESVASTPAAPRYPVSQHDHEDVPQRASRIAPGGFHMYNINEMVSVMGKKKKMPTTMGVNLKTGIILIAPEHAQDGPTQEWTADKMTHYSREGKHVFLEFVRPSRSIDFHAGAKDTAEEIVSALGELAGAIRAAGLREVIMAGTGRAPLKRGQVLYDFEAQGEDEVAVMAGDEVIITDDTKSEEWWQVRRLKTGREGVVPSSYIEVTGEVQSASKGVDGGKSTVAQNRLEEERLTKEALKKERQQDSKRENSRSSSKPKPDQTKLRTWTDRSKTFSVEAQFLGLKDGKINLHKMNGVKIAVPVAKMSIQDIEYVERITGISLDEDKPLSEVRRAKSTRAGPSSSRDSRNASRGKVGASVEPSKPGYDWFQFFLSCEVTVGLCERYAQAFEKDSMDESVLPDVDASVLRNLGLREGDIIKVMRTLDKKFNRDGKKKSAGDEDANGGLFSGPGGTLRNNTRKGRPAPTVQTNDTVDAKAFSQDRSAEHSASPSPNSSQPSAEAKNNGRGGGFDDDAWDVKPARQSEAKPTPSPESSSVPAQTARPPTQSMQDLSLLSSPLEPTKAQPPPPAPALVMPPQPASNQQPSPPQQQQGATPSFFGGIASQQTGIQPTPTGQQPLNLGLSGSRHRPTPPQTTGSGPLAPPPPARPLSAPQNAQPSAFAPPSTMQPQVTGIAPPGQSLNDLSQQRMYAQQQPYITGLQPQVTGFQPGIVPQQTGFGPNQYMPPQQFQPLQNQPTSFGGANYGFGQQQQQQPVGGVNSYLPPALEPQRTAMGPMQHQPTGYGQGFNPGMHQQQPPPPPIAPLQPQQTGPAPPVRFGVPEKLAPQATGRRANLSQATPQNPFGF